MTDKVLLGESTCTISLLNRAGQISKLENSPGNCKHFTQNRLYLVLPYTLYNSICFPHILYVNMKMYEFDVPSDMGFTSFDALYFIDILKEILSQWNEAFVHRNKDMHRI